MCLCVHAKLLQLCRALCNPMDCSPPGSSVHGILQARILGWVAKPSSRGSSHPRDQTQVLCLLHWQAGYLPLTPSGKPHRCIHSPPNFPAKGKVSNRQRGHHRAEQRLGLPPGTGAKGLGCCRRVEPIASGLLFCPGLCHVPSCPFLERSPQWVSPNFKLPSYPAGTRGRRDRLRMELSPILVIRLRLHRPA